MYQRKKMMRLIRHTAMTLFWAGALFLTGCQYDSVINDLRDAGRGDDSRVIRFNNGVIDNPVSTRAVTLLSDHLNTMGVWGWQTTGDGAVERLFLNKEVTFNAALAKWTYSPPKYWENKSSYRFYAYAPHSSTDPGVKVSIDTISGHIDIKGVTLRGSNTVSATDTVTPGNFSHVQDIDWMLDRMGQNLMGTYKNEVTFNMNHILSKLCIKASKSSNFVAHDSALFIRIDSMKVGQFISQGNFTQRLANSPSPADTTQFNFTKSEWETVDTLPRYVINGALGVDITDSPAYVIESLLIPQPTESGQMIDIWYSLGVDGGYVNRFHYSMQLSDVFSGFISGCNFIIEFIIGPKAITFDSGVTNWDYVDDTF